VWFNPDYSPVENLFRPPDVEEFSDYFICIHIFQIIVSSNNREISIFKLRDQCNLLGYAQHRTDRILKWLTSIDESKNHHIEEDTELINGKVFPLLDIYNNDKIVIEIYRPLNSNSNVKLTQWGMYHLNTIIYQIEYWNHILYDMYIPKSFENQMRIENNEFRCKFNVNILLKYLKNEEESWFKTKSSNLNIRISPIMNKIYRRFSKSKLLKTNITKA